MHCNGAVSSLTTGCARLCSLYGGLQRGWPTDLQGQLLSTLVWCVCAGEKVRFQGADSDTLLDQALLISCSCTWKSHVWDAQKSGLVINRPTGGVRLARMWCSLSTPSPSTLFMARLPLEVGFHGCSASLLANPGTAARAAPASPCSHCSHHVHPARGCFIPWLISSRLL